MSDLARAHLIIEGRVQGVFFRAFTRDVGNRHRLKGWVRNLPDGNVEAVFEGERSVIEDAIGQCYKGPPASRVTNIEVEWEDYRGEFDAFTIRYS